MSAKIIEFPIDRCRRDGGEGLTSLNGALISRVEAHRANSRLLRSPVPQPSLPEPAEGADPQPSMLAGVTPITSDPVVIARATLAAGREEFRAALQRLRDSEERRLLDGTREASIAVREDV